MTRIRMARMDQSAIDLSSSPEPSMSLARRKLKPKPKPRSRTSPFPIIELTDSDSDDAPTLSPQRKKIPNNAVAGTSSHPSGMAALQPKIGLSGSFENIPNTPNRMLKAPIARAFPLLELSDEENEPPESPFVAVLPIVERFSPFETVEMEDVQPAKPPAAVATVDPVPEADPISTYVARALEIVPDVDPDYLLDLVTQSIPSQGDQVVEHVLHGLFENPMYPKVDRKGKRKQADGDAEGDEMPSKKTKLDYRNKERPYNGGVHYADMALEQLQTDFPYIPKAYIRMSLANFDRFYAPTYFFLQDQARQHQQLEQQNQVVIYPYTRRATPFRPSRKGKGRAIHDAEFEQERAWLLEELIKDDQVVADDGNKEEYEDCGDGIECGCCFSAYPFDKMVQCPEAHLFCTACMTSYASTLLGSHDTNIKCMHQSGCTVPIPRSELQRFLPKKLMDLWERLTQRKEVHAAGLDGWEECPFCEWGCVIENPDEKLFRCENLDGCGVVSCRGCKKVDHLPKSCKEMEEDKNLDGRHAIEEAMTRALMRNCPKCQKAFIKEYGCNKMTCPECGTLSCYVCKQAITGYDHFNQTPQGAPGYQGSSQNPTDKCVLHDTVEQRHTTEVKEAAERAFEKYKQEHPDVDEAAIKVDLPPGPAVPQAIPNVQYAIGQLPPFMGANPFINVAPMAQLQLGGNGVPIPQEQPWMYNQRLEEIAQAHARIDAARARLRLERDAARIAEHARQQLLLAARAQEEANQMLNAYRAHNHPELAIRRRPARNQPPPAPPAIRRNPRRR